MSSDSSSTVVPDEKARPSPEWNNGSRNTEKKLQTGAGLPHRRAKRKEKGPLELFCGWVMQHQIGLSVNLLMLLALTHICFPRARRHTRKFFELSYYNAKTGEYRVGWNDAFMVNFWIVVFTGMRAAVMDYILTPLAFKSGVKTARDRTRFAEQAWLLVYYFVFWPLGMYIWMNSEYWGNLREMWTHWPKREMEGVTKWYLLVQYSFWLQQILVIHLEERRKDHWQMLAHHLVTTLLIFCSYGYHFTKVANVILCLMDVVDILLSFSKCMKYSGFTWICDVLFGIFMLSWVGARHIGYLWVCWSVWHHIPITIDYGCYRGKYDAIVGPFPVPTDSYTYLLEPFQDPEGMVCFNDMIRFPFLAALLFLQGITILWFSMILKVAIRVLQGGDADDVRSDNEGGDEIDIEEELLDATSSKFESTQQQQTYYEEEVGVESINLKGRTSNASRYKKSASSSSSVSLPGNSDRKELLGRIGCDKGV